MKQDLKESKYIILGYIGPAWWSWNYILTLELNT